MNASADGGFRITIAGEFIEYPDALSKLVINVSEYGFSRARCAPAQYCARSCTRKTEDTIKAVRKIIPAAKVMSRMLNIF